MNNFNLWADGPDEILTTEVGSLPHHNVDAALEHAFRLNIPFLPQIPVRNHREFMIQQALEQLQGVVITKSGEFALNPELWLRRETFLAKNLEQAFASSETNAFATFEPTSEAYSGWQPFLWEIEERKIKLAKIQIAGPLTSQWSLRVTDGTPADRMPEIGIQIFRLILARAIAMVRKVKAHGATALFYLDEPGLYGLNPENPRHLLGLQELKLFIQTLRKEKAIVGLHCCSNTDWPSVLSLGLEVLSIDSSLSLVPLMRHKAALKTFLDNGGRLSLGVIPTAKGAEDVERFDSTTAFEQLVNDLFENGMGDEKTVQELLKKTIFTPACGLALHRIEDAEIILSDLAEFAAHVRNYC
jgi:hypothetical protein